MITCQQLKNSPIKGYYYLFFKIKCKAYKTTHSNKHENIIIIKIYLIKDNVAFPRLKAIIPRKRTKLIIPKVLKYLKNL